ncbi:hypothetical protein K1719_010122 [Acacia pycnantha]|nr:hypothetical protein K1719_010122 [Acacia pycnantha]
MMKNVKILDIDMCTLQPFLTAYVFLILRVCQNLQDEMMEGNPGSLDRRRYNVPDDIDEENLMGELDAMEADIGNETEADRVPSTSILIKNLIWRQSLTWP